jgi:drug/metabolite transporter (DMT)-like permease
VELSGAVAVTSLGLAIMQPSVAELLPKGMDWVWLLILAYGCTLLPHYLTLKAMKQVSAFAANLTINLELVYGVIFAIVFFREDKSLSPNFYTGVAIVLIAVFSHPFLKKRFERSL